MLLQAHTGSQNFPDGSSKLHLFFVPTRRHAGQEQHIGFLAKGANPDVRVTATNIMRMPAQNGAPTTLGEWTSANYDVPEGVVLKLFGMKRVLHRGQHINTIMASMFICMRSGAALNSIDFALVDNPRSPIQRATIQGRFDILDIRQAAQLGISISPQTMNQLAPNTVARLFTVRELERQIVAKQEAQVRTIRNSEGQSVAVSKAVVRRAVKL